MSRARSKHTHSRGSVPSNEEEATETKRKDRRMRETMMTVTTVSTSSNNALRWKHKSGSQGAQRFATNSGGGPSSRRRLPHAVGVQRRRNDVLLRATRSDDDELEMEQREVRKKVKTRSYAANSRTLHKRRVSFSLAKILTLDSSRSCERYRK